MAFERGIRWTATPMDASSLQKGGANPSPFGTELRTSGRGVFWFEGVAAGEVKWPGLPCLANSISLS